MEKFIKRGFAFILILLPVLMYLSYHIPQNKVFNPEAEVELTFLTPVSSIQSEEGIAVFTYDVGDRPLACDSLYIQSKHSAVTVTAGDMLLYSLNRGEKPWMNTTGTVYDLVFLPSDVQTIEVTVENLYPGISGNRADIYMGNGSEIDKVVTKGAFFPTIISITEIFIGAMMLVIWLFFRMQRQKPYALFYLALFSLAVGTWSLSSSPIFILIVKNSAAASATSFVTLMFFAVPFIQFSKYYFGYNPRIADIASLSSIIANVLMIGLYLFGIAGLKQTVTINHIHIAFAALFYIYSFIRYFMSGKHRRRMILNITASAILMASTVIDFFLYFSHSMQSNSAGRVGFIIYFFMLGTDTIGSMASDLQESRKAAIYKELAFTDNLTKLYNRNAFMNYEQQMAEPAPVSVINIDLNDLKKCNDTFGHVNGDKYIADSAKIIKDVFGEYGKCYRVGGDEFAVLLRPACEDAEIDILLQKLEKQEETYNQAATVIQMHMAYGYDKYDPSSDKSIEAACTRADAKMYEHKRLLKEKYGGTIR